MADVDIATLGLRVDATQVNQADQALRNLTSTSQRAEQATNAYTQAQRSSTINLQAATAEYDRMFGSIEDAHAEALRMNAAMNAAGSSAVRSSAGLSRFNMTLASVARQAAGAHPAVGQLVNVVSTFAVGTAVTTGVLAGLAAVAIAVRRIGQEARDTRQRLLEAETVLGRLGGVDPVTSSMAEVQRRFDANTRQLAFLRDALSTPAIVAQREALFEENMRLAPLLTLGGGDIEGRAAEERARERRERLQIRLASDAAAEAYRARQREIAERNGAGARNRDARMEEITNELFQFRGPSERQSAVLSQETMLDTLGRRETVLARMRAEQTAAEERLASARERANASLVLSLSNVGRAYGGVVDQVLALAAATLSLERMPMLSGQDRARAYGAAGLTGIGFGATTGNPLLGAAGGAASGFAMTGNPAGAIIGAVGGIVSGLFESGRRAEEARRIWQRTLEDFDRMFDTLTPLESNIEQLNSAFEQLSGGRTRSELEQYVALLEQWRASLGLGDAGLSAGLQNQIDQYNELLRIYDENTKQATELADAENELHDARFRSLNAPTGFNLAYFGYRAGAGFDAQPTGGDSGGVSVFVYVDGEQVASRVEKRRTLKGYRGGTTTETAR